MSRNYIDYNQYLGAQRCCNLKVQGPQGPQGPTGPAAIGIPGVTGPSVLDLQEEVVEDLQVNPVPQV
jgi:hypothetical protein